METVERDGRDVIELCLPLLQGLLDRMVFTGGCVVGLLVDEPVLIDPRTTDDADAIVAVSDAPGYVLIQQALIDRGWNPDMNLICRFRRGPLTIDVMPPDERILGFANRWYALGLERVLDRSVGGQAIRVVAPEVFLATKIEAFADRGKSDPLGSHDFEDICYVLSGRQDLVGRIATSPDELRGFLRDALPGLFQSPKGQIGLEGALANHPPEAYDAVLSKIEEIANLP